MGRAIDREAALNEFRIVSLISSIILSRLFPIHDCGKDKITPGGDGEFIRKLIASSIPNAFIRAMNALGIHSLRTHEHSGEVEIAGVRQRAGNATRSLR